MSYVFATLIALTLGIALPSICMAIVRRFGGALAERRAERAYAQDARRAGVRLPPAWRLAHGRAGAPLPPTRHARPVKVSDTAA